MVVSGYVFETRGGAILTDFEPAKCPWDETANAADTVKVDIDLNGPEGDRDWGNLITPWKHSIALEVGGKYIGGPIMPHNIQVNDGMLTATARGIRVAMDHRSILPVTALTRSLIGADGKPDPVLNSTWSNLELGSIGMRIVEQMIAWPGWTDVPIVLPAARAGTATRTYTAVDRKSVDGALSDLSGVRGGPDIRLRLRKNGDRFEWVYEAGTASQPRLQGDVVFDWDITEQSGMSIDSDPSKMASVVWSESGRSDDVSAIAMLYDDTLVKQGFPLLEIESGASSSTTQTATLDAWNAETARISRGPWKFWSFNVRADQSPYPFEYAPGDLVNVHVPPGLNVRGGVLPAGDYVRRIAQLSGDETDWIKITCAEVLDG
jgi:hypothetical protein